MSQIIGDVKLGGSWFGVFYTDLEAPVFSADRVQRVVGVFVSPVLDATAELLSWKEISWSATVPTGTRLYFYVRSAGSSTAVEKQEWEGPLLNPSGEDVSSQSGRYFQFRIAAYSSYSSGTMNVPTIDSVRAGLFLKSNEERFFTQKVDLGFKPEHILLTYNGTVPDDALVRFAVSGEGSSDLSDYQFINPNQVEKLDLLSDASDGLKIMISGISSAEVPFIIDEFAVAFSGDDQKKVNKT